MKKEVKKNISSLAPHEKDRLMLELDKPRDLDNERRFYSFINLLDEKRKVYIGDYLEEWDKYFKERKI
jgi:hypothetical protein